MPDNKLYFWFDMETNGHDLDPNAQGHYSSNHFQRGMPLEVAFRITDSAFDNWTISTNEGEIPYFSSLIHIPSSMLDDLINSAPPAVQAMHDESGLWLALEYSTSRDMISRVDTRMSTVMLKSMNLFAQWLQDEDEIPDVRLVLAGSGVSHYDSRWLKRYFPLTWAILDGYNYETKPTVDIGVVRRFLQGFVPPVGDMFAKPENTIKHRALDDVNQIIQEAKNMQRILS